MNERIFKLAKQADIIQWDTLPWSGARTPDHESVVKAKKFAELIVKECSLWIINNADAMDAMEHLGPSHFARAMQKDFGVDYNNPVEE
jgi:hypothetical protein